MPTNSCAVSFPACAAVAMVALSCHESRGNGEPPAERRTLTAEEAERGVTLPFYAPDDGRFEIRETYYVAQNEPGASNGNNGRFPTHRGGQDGPFANLNDSRIRSLLSGDGGVRMVVRAGVYRLEQLGGRDSGLVLQGSGNERHPVILTSYPGEETVLDGGETLTREQLLGIRRGGQYEIKIQQTLMIEGRHNIVENLTIRNGFRYNVLVLGQYSVIRGNKLLGAYEDSIKTADGADYGLIADNDISGFASQGIDSFASSQWLVKNNRIHHPQLDPVTDEIEGNGIGGKGGIENYVIVGNTIHDFDTNRRVGALALGGGGTLSLYRADALGRLRHAGARMMAFGNTIYNYQGPAVHFHSCLDCQFAGNTVYDTLGGVSLDVSDDEARAETNRGLPATRNATVRDNRFAGNHAPLDVCREGGEIPVGTTCFAMFVHNREALDGFVSEGNAYFSDSPPRFAVRDEKVDLLTQTEFQDRVGADRTSPVRPLAEFKK